MQDKSARTLRANNAGHPRGAATPGLSAGGWRGVLEGLRVGSEGNWTRRAREAGGGEARGAAPGQTAGGREGTLEDVGAELCTCESRWGRGPREAAPGVTGAGGGAVRCWP